ncbi:MULTISPECIES: RNA polymerase sigma factor [Nostocales]|uniref:Sigma-70 family RNA polymerase sigma factor n=4 Tax=Nostocales TaxID=1161 RepID=A0A8S9T687_9CYAN|nr:sigma-70 family RNA polymerase sigma factor [Tolypothrix bouteillei]KAF3888081.1 sigma-70 family RNA polymerase sigma factor [Tolypothrix bouteillei VB521301]
MRSYQSDLLSRIITNAMDKSSNDIYGVRGFIIKRIQQFNLNAEINYTTVLAEAYYRIYAQIINKDKEIQNMESYIRKVAINFLIETLRKRQREWNCGQRLARMSLKEHLNAEYEKLDKAFTKSQIAKALKKLEKRQRTLFRLRVYADWSYGDIATYFVRLGWEQSSNSTTHNKLSKQYSRILEKLRDSLSEL